MPPIDQDKALRMVKEWLVKMEKGHLYGSITLNSQDGKVQGLRFEITYREDGKGDSQAFFTPINPD